MLRYPLLSADEQLALPSLKAKPVEMQSKFQDSTHQLWHCKTEDGAMVLKVCNHDAIGQSTFWYGVNTLFGADFPNTLDQIRKTHKLVAKKGSFAIPDLVASEANRFVITRYLAGKDVDAKMVTDKMVIQLAKHISQLHQQTYEKWGYLHAPDYAAIHWGKQLQETLLRMAEQSAIEIPKSFLHSVITQAGLVNEKIFVPMMLDLRWDQLRLLDKGQISELALIDLDAFVIGPRTLELILLEYLLTAEKFSLFKSQYMQDHDWPDYSLQKPCYQLLLFLMNVLGEQDLDRWMGQY